MKFSRVVTQIAVNVAASVTFTAYAASGSPVQHSDEGSTVRPSAAASAKRAAAERPTPAQLPAHREWTNVGDGSELRQHAYTFSRGRLRHSDDISHDTPRPGELLQSERKYDDRN